MLEGKENRDGTVARPSKLVPRLIASSVFILIITFIVLGVYSCKNYLRNSDTSETHLLESWKNRDYKSCYKVSGNILELVSYDNNLALTYHGYSAFYLAMAENDTAQSIAYLDEAINSIRLSMITADKDLLPQLYYMLGKSYFYKDFYSSYNYYADLAIQYLNKSIESGYKSPDIPEFLGLSYASLDMTMESIAAFSQALLVRESDTLLLSIAEQYYKAGQSTTACQYLFRISQDCKDEKILDKSHIILGNIYIGEEKYDEAEKEFEMILEKNPNSGDAYYGIGVIYEKRGDLVKARSCWRKTLKIQYNHPEALKKLADYK